MSNLDMDAVILAEVAKGLDEMGVEIEATYQGVLATRIGTTLRERGYGKVSS
jgi:hypothetical protein